MNLNIDHSLLIANASTNEICIQIIKLPLRQHIYHTKAAHISCVGSGEKQLQCAFHAIGVVWENFVL